MANAAEKYGSHAVLVTSFTKAAAMELAMRNLPLHKDRVGTLHAHCYRALEHPEIADTHLPEWNKHQPGFRLPPITADLDEPEPEFTIHTLGDELYGKLQILRARMEPEERWPHAVRRFACAWRDWKRSNGMMDFTDLLETALRNYKVAPGDPKVIFVDEAQDLSRLQLALVRQWGRHAEHLLLAGDDDQAILTFAGAEPAALLERGGPEFFRHVLLQSYRVPRAIHALAEAWIHRLTSREPKEYRPREHDGEIRMFHRGNYKCPTGIVDDAERHLAQGKRVMFLTTCNYMLEPLKRTLRQRGLPFFNPYRRKRVDWNPLAPVPRGASAADRLLSFLKPHPDSLDAPWAGEDLRRWTTWLRADSLLLDGAMDVIKKISPTTVVTLRMLRQFFERESLEQLLAAVSEKPLKECVQWWLDHLAVKKRKQADYPARVALLRGVKALADTPHIIIGTGHSVKGGEADVVYVFPDLSASGMSQWEGNRKDRDAVIRLGYVMITRARETLVICEPASAHHMPLAGFAARVMRERRGNTP